MNFPIHCPSLFRPARPANRDDASRRKAARRLRPTLDSLKARTVLSTATLVVTDPVDNPYYVTPQSLRGAIQQADAEPAGTDVVIDFKIGGGGLATTLIVAPLPAITRPVTIDGTSQPPYRGATGVSNVANVVLDGAALRSVSDGLVFTAGASGSIVKGLVVGHFGSAGLRFSGASNIQLVNNIVGLERSGSYESIAPNQVGVEFDGGSNETIVDDVIAGNALDGLRLIGTSRSLVTSSNIGADQNGAYSLDSNGNSLGNGGVAHYGSGLYINNGANNTITNNLVSNNGTYGILLAGTSAAGNSITGNKIGTDSTGYLARPNQTGIRIAAGANNNIVSGGNTISGNSWDGIQIDGQGTVENEVIANKIGTSPDATSLVPNWNGIQIIDGAGYSFVFNNTISGNSSDGVFLSQTQYNDIQGNQIGLGIYGVPAGNGIYGIILVGGAWNNTIYGNNIQYNRSAGLATFGAGWSNGFYYNTVTNNGDGNFIWD